MLPESDTEAVMMNSNSGSQVRVGELKVNRDRPNNKKEKILRTF